MSTEDARAEWARQQMTEANLPQPIMTSVYRLLEVWWTMRHTQSTMDLTLDSFCKLARSEALVQPLPDARWVPVKPGNIVIRDQVRVKADAYKGDAGLAHNGRHGIVVGIRYGDVIVTYKDGKQPAMQAVHHRPDSLEKRVQ